MVGWSGDHQIAHAGVIAAGAGAEVGHGPGQIVAALAGEARHRAIALETVEMTARATDRAVRGPGALCDVLGRAGLAEIRPRLLRKIIGDRHHVASLEGGRDRLHDLALAIAALEVAELDVEIAGLLSPDNWNRLVGRLAILAMAAGTDLDFLVQRLGA